jgi:RNA polymerase sigma-70 factor (ECF subfamily)
MWCAAAETSPLGWIPLTDAGFSRYGRPVSDEALVRALAGGDREALGRLYDRYAALLIGVGYQILGNRREAEDLLHDVFLEAWRQAGQYDPGRGSVRAWLVMRTRSRALDRRKSAGFSRQVPLELGRLDAAASAGTAHHDPALAADCVRLRRALAALPGEQRAVLELSYFEGLSAADIAERVGVPIGTVKSRTAAALAKLRASLGGGDG